MPVLLPLRLTVRLILLLEEGNHSHFSVGNLFAAISLSFLSCMFLHVSFLLLDYFSDSDVIHANI